MLRWARMDYGWALNLDGSDAAERFALPRVELRSAAKGWRATWLLANGNARELAVVTAVDSPPAAKLAAIELLRAAATEHRPALDELLGASGR